MGNYKEAEDILFWAAPEYVNRSVCGSRSRCFQAVAVSETVGFPVEVAVNEVNGQILAGWDEPIPGTGKFLHHVGSIEPLDLANALLCTNDNIRKTPASRRRALLAIVGAGLEMRLVRHRVTRYTPTPPRTDEQRKRERDRRHELARLRAEGLLPPPIPRQPYVYTSRALSRRQYGEGQA